ncbi:MAG: FimB/Mfa2 family fimbrial subunit [Prevotella sp.]|nr:FimB/Mfa2 family fimbrial subunit [Prevotella sp.]
MKTYKFNCILFTVIVALFSVIFSSCTKEELVNPPKVTLTTDWTNRTTGIAIPSPYTVVINNKNLTYHSVSNNLPELEAGSYPVTIYNYADKVTINGSTATVATSGSIVDAQPGYLFYSELDIEFENDKEKTVTAVMQQQVRRLNIELTVTDGNIGNIESITASLSGVANTINLKDGTYSGTAQKVEPVFTKSGNKLIASVRLIGLTAEVQNLTLDISYAAGSPQQITTDMSSYLTDFGTDKHIPVTLSGNISISKSGITFNSEISGWESQGQIDGIDANEQ